MTDRFTKLLLAAIALGLWINVVGDWIRPVPVQAQSDRRLRNIERTVDDIERTVDDVQSTVDSIALGICLNPKIC